MASVYSTSFIRSHGGAGGSFTVPGGTIAIIRCITAFNASAIIPESAQVFLGHSSCTIYEVTLNVFIGPSRDYYDAIELRVVVEADDTINVSSGADVDMTVSGYLLTVAS